MDSLKKHQLRFPGVIHGDGMDMKRWQTSLNVGSSNEIWKWNSVENSSSFNDTALRPRPLKIFKLQGFFKEFVGSRDIKAWKVLKQLNFPIIELHYSGSQTFHFLDTAALPQDKARYKWSHYMRDCTAFILIVFCVTHYLAH